MRAVWVYRDYNIVPKYKNQVAGNCELFLEREWKVFSGALATWQILNPEIERVIYLDKSVYSFLETKDFLKRFDKVCCVDFEKELDCKYSGITFFAAPKLWALTQQDEPCCLLDTETMLFQDFNLFYNNNYISVQYEESNPIHMKNWELKDLKEFYRIKQGFGENSSFLRPDLMINAGFTTWPDPEITRKVGEKALQICEEVCNLNCDWRYKWTLCEESILVALVRSFGKDFSLYSYSEFSKLPFVEWSSAGVNEHQYKEYLWWMQNHPSISANFLKVLDKYAEY